MVRRLSVLLLLLGGFLGTGRAQTQFTPSLARSYQAASVYRFAEPGDIISKVNVWGAVRNPGLYEVPEGTRLSTLLSLAGGPAITERRNRDRRTITLRLIREGEARRGAVFESLMENEILVSDDDPVLQEGDVLAVEILVRQRFSWKDAFPIVAAIASVALAIERVSQ